MKKVALLFFVMILVMANVNAEEKSDVVNSQKNLQQVQVHMKNHRDMTFERRLNLTEVQKLKAREIRKKGHEKLSPVINEIKLKKQEAEMVRRSRIAVQMQEEKLAIIDVELKKLEKKANEIRKLHKIFWWIGKNTRLPIARLKGISDITAKINNLLKYFFKFLV